MARAQGSRGETSAGLGYFTRAFCLLRPCAPQRLEFILGKDKTQEVGFLLHHDCEG